jgi:hypothetical protein
MVCGNRRLPCWAPGPATEELCCTVQRAYPRVQIIEPCHYSVVSLLTVAASYNEPKDLGR